jgi:hypothetical protein
MIPKAKFLLLFFIAGLIAQFAFSSYVKANHGLIWTKYIGGKGNDELHSSIYTTDNCLLLVGESNSFTDNDYDIYVAKVDLNGNLLWNITHSDPVLSEDDAAYQAIETRDGYIITGKITSLEGIGDDVLVLKLDKNGNKLWSKNIGGNSWDWGNDLIQLPDNTILILATTQDFFRSPYDPWLINIDSSGNELWKKRFKYPDDQYPTTILTDSNQDLLILGTTSSTTGSKSNIFLLKTDSSGHEIWYKEYGGPEKETASKIVPYGNDFLITGTTNSYGAGRNDAYIIKIDANGNIQWEKTVGSPSDESSENIGVNSGTIIITSNTFKNSGNSQDQYLITLNSNGDTIFNQTYGTTVYEKAINTHPINQNTYYITGNKGTNNKDISITKINLETHRLRIDSTVGNTYGAGNYYLGATPVFGVPEEIVYEGNHIRYLFKGWTSANNGGYNGQNNPAQITIQNDVTQIATWQKQYYVKINSPNGSTTSVSSGWFNEGDHVTIHASIEDGFTFNEWEGLGPGSYTGTNQKADLTILGPITQTLILGNVSRYHLELISEYSETIGSGEYYEGTWVDFDITQKEFYLDNSTRYVFERWTSSSENGYNGIEPANEIILMNDITEQAVWKKQYYVNISSNIPNADFFETGWYDEGSELRLFCDPDEGYKFTGWQGEGIGSYSGSESTFSLTLEAPICEKANITEANSYVLRILSEYGDVPESTLYYEDTKVNLSIKSEIIYLSNNTRVRFVGWRTYSEEGYTGDKNGVNMQITSDIVEEAVWIKQYYISSSDSSLNSWVDENTVLELPHNTTGIIIPVSKVYKVGSSVIKDSIVVSDAVVIQVSTRRSYLNVLFLAIFTIFSGSIYQYRKYKIKLDAKKNQIMNHVLLNASISLLDISTNYDLTFSKANEVAAELGQNENIFYDFQSLTLFTHNGMAMMIENTLRDFGAIELNRLAQIMGIKDDLLYSIVQSDENIIIENNIVKLI